MEATRRLRWSCLAATIALAACGGGSGGGSGSPGPTDPPPPSGSTPGTINQSNAQDAAVVGIALLEAPVQLALAGLNPLIGMLDAKQLEQDLVCGSGAIELTTADNDGSGAVSSGDVVTVSYTDGCISGALNAPVLGEIELVINDLVLLSPGYLILQANVSFPGDLDVATEFAETLVSGGFAVTAVVRSVTFELLTIDVAAPAQLSLTIGSGSEQVTERVTGLALRREVAASRDAGRPLLLSATSAIQSELLGGSIECRTIGDLATPDALEMPSSGILECSGASGSAVRLDSSGSASSSPALLVDPEGDGSFVEVSGGPFHWSDFVEGELITERLVSRFDMPAPARPLLAQQTLAAVINRFVYAPIRNRLYATTDTSVLEIDPATLVISRSLDLAGNPGAIAVSQDESALWVGLDASSELQRIDLADMAAGITISLEPSDLGVARTIEDVHVAPGTTDLVVVAATHSREMIAFNNGVQLANVIDDNDSATLPPERFLFRNATEIVGASASSASDAFRITLDPVTGLTVDRNLHRLVGSSSGPLKAGAADIYTTNGTIFNERLETVEGRLEPSLFFCCYRAVAVDAQSGEIYAVSDADALDLYAEDNLVRTGEYSLPEADFAARIGDVVLTPEYLLFARGEFLERYERSEIVANLPQETCERLDLSGLLVDGVYVMLDCAATDLVLDIGRNVLYAGLGPATPAGNSIAVIDLDSFRVVDRIPLGGSPGMLKLSADNSTLFAELTDTNRFAEIDLDSRAVSSPILGLNRFGPNFMNSFAPARGIDGDIIASMNGDVVLLNGGAAVGVPAEFQSDYSELFVAEDGGTAFGHDTFRLGVYNISSSGVAFLQFTDDVISPAPADREGRFIYSTDGRRFDMVTHASDQPCGSPASATFTRVGHDEFSGLLYFSTVLNDVRNIDDYLVVACDPAAAVTGEPERTLVFKLDEGDVQNVIPLQDNRIVIHTDTHLVLLDRPS